MATANETNHVLHVLITFMTCGLWAPVWMLLWELNNRYHCTKCGCSV